MFQIDAALNRIPHDYGQVVDIVRALNEIPVAIPSLPTEPCRAMVAALCGPDGGFNVYIALYLTGSHQQVIYVADQAVPGEEYQELFGDANAFLESMGFILDDTNFRSLPANEQSALIDELPVLPSPVKASLRPMSSTTRESQHPRPHRSRRRGRQTQLGRSAPAGASSRFVSSFLVLALAVAACGPTQANRRSADIQLNLARHARDSGNLPDAIKQYQQVVELDDTYPDAHRELGLIYFFAGELELAEKHLKRALELKPDFTDVFNDLGALAKHRGRYAEAEQWFQKALNDITYTGRSMAEGNLGWVLYKQGRHDEAIAHLRNAIGYNPRFCAGMLWLSEIMQEKKNHASVARELERFVHVCIDDEGLRKHVPANTQAEAFYRLGQAKAQMDDVEGACMAFQRCTDLKDAGGGIASAAARLGF